MVDSRPLKNETGAQKSCVKCAGDEHNVQINCAVASFFLNNKISNRGLQDVVVLTGVPDPRDSGGQVSAIPLVVVIGRPAPFGKDRRVNTLLLIAIFCGF